MTCGGGLEASFHQHTYAPGVVDVLEGLTVDS